MRRFYQRVFEEHFKEHRQMLFVMGPRQAGKTTASLNIVEQWGTGFYYNWDRLEDRLKILAGSRTIAEDIGLSSLMEKPPLVIFDEIHKYSDWKNFLKGFYDSYPNQAKILVTGSARLNVYKKGGDSLMGRYLYYHFHPLTVAELIDPDHIAENEFRLPKPIEESQFQTLLKFGGFPDPFLKDSERFSNRWKSLRFEQLFKEDIRTISQIQEVGQMEVLAELLRLQAGQLVSYESFAKKVRISNPTVRNWIEVLKSLYYCFEVRPYSENISRSLLKEPKYYLWDWSLCEDEGALTENFVAAHLLKAVHFWTDYGLGQYHLNYLRDKEKREVDFVIVKNGKPWILIEVKTSNNKQISSSLSYFQEMTRAPYAFQIVLNIPFVNRSCFEIKNQPIIVPARTFLSQLI